MTKILELIQILMLFQDVHFFQKHFKELPEIPENANHFRHT